MRSGHRATGNPDFLVTNRQGSGSDPAAVEMMREGLPVLEGLRSFLTGVRCLLGWRDHRARPSEDIKQADPDVAGKWRLRLAGGATLDEHDSLQLLADFGLPVNPVRRISGRAELLEAAAEFGYPLVLKTAQPGILHKTDCNGVILGIGDSDQLLAAYTDLAERLGAQALVSPMLRDPGVEMVLGLVHDDQFGPLVMTGFGGINVETLHDVAYALPPFGRATARRLLDSLQLRPLLDGQRDRPALDVDAFCEAAERFSVMAAGLAGSLDEVDINPVIVLPDGCTAVDALVVARKASPSDTPG